MNGRQSEKEHRPSSSSSSSTCGECLDVIACDWSYRGLRWWHQRRFNPLTSTRNPFSSLRTLLGPTTCGSSYPSSGVKGDPFLLEFYLQVPPKRQRPPHPFHLHLQLSRSVRLQPLLMAVQPAARTRCGLIHELLVYHRAHDTAALEHNIFHQAVMCVQIAPSSLNTQRLGSPFSQWEMTF